ncbi:hypothetical protein EUTSA_v10019037mg [Eutrema salsugineum]|uniref:Pentacotripeptide-repeat region of PRORP domain-containing protein n=2 Tax=Eutrema salsugineum TaxID=72664 RepID=V4M7E1_EUTSA|nr:hypothetical protein EUTSA_v10019037mg [Eutrema salsugineum]
MIWALPSESVRESAGDWGTSVWMALSLSLGRPSLSVSLSVVAPRRRFASIRCGPRDNRGPLLKGRILSSEAIQSIQSLKRAHRTGSVSLSLPPLRRLLKADLLAVLRELLRQDQCTLAVHVLSTLRSEYPPVDLTLYAEVVTALSRNGEWEEIDRLMGELEGIEGGYESDKALTKLIKAVVGAERRETAVRIYEMMREGGWGSESWQADEYVAEVLRKGLKRLGEEDLATQVAATQNSLLRVSRT